MVMIEAPTLLRGEAATALQVGCWKFPDARALRRLHSCRCRGVIGLVVFLHPAHNTLAYLYLIVLTI